MKEIQIPRKNSTRSSDPATKRIIIKDPELKNRKVKRQSATVGSTKDPSDFDPIYFAISDHEAESFLQGSSVDLLPTPEICDESPVSTVTNEAFHVIDAAIAADLPASVQSLRDEISDLKKTICSVESSDESKRIDGAVTLKFRVVVFAFVLWALFAAVVVGVSSGEEVAYSGPLPT
ncbi:unnamed protein product [Brassica rapa]|uniref:Uncharacterized protein n=1 Tax=Brassica campestris TaxID=3711 RepID=A0A3P5ZK00_BRACM|nr:unnamed protein product [Brassica rapa]VDC73151.1 unnamed protein product [Brassica rapa]